MKQRTITFISLFFCLIFCVACNSSFSPQANGEKLEIIVSIPPQKYFTQRIGGDRTNVNVMVRPGMDPHTYEPTPAQMKSLSQAQLYFSIGVEFEDVWLPRFQDANPKLKFVDSSAGVERIAMATNENQTGELDPHIWLSPTNVRIIAKNIADALCQSDPQNSALYQNNLKLLLADIDKVDKDIHTVLDPLSNRKFITLHPAWGYFARDYNLEQIAIEVGGNEPSAAEMANLIEIAKKENIHIILAQPEFNTTAAETIAQEIDGKVVFLSPLEENWLENMEKVAHALAGEMQ